MLIGFLLLVIAGCSSALAGFGRTRATRGRGVVAYGLSAVPWLAALAMLASASAQTAPQGEIVVMDEVFREGAISAGSFSPRIPAGWREWRLDGAPQGPVGGLSKEHAYASPKFHSLSIPVPDRGAWGWESAQAPLRGRSRPPRINFVLRPSADFSGGAPVAILLFVDAQGAPMPAATQVAIDLPPGDAASWTERVVALDPARIPEGAGTFMMRLGVRRTDGPASGAVFFGLVRAMLPNADGTGARVRGAQPFNWFAFGDPVVFKPQGELPEGTTTVKGRVLDSEGREVGVKTVDAATFASGGWNFIPKAPGHYSVVFTAHTPTGNVLLADEYHDRAQNNQIALFQPEGHAFAVVRPRDADRPPATALGYHITCSNGRIRSMGDTEVRIAKLAGASFARFHVTWPELEPAKGQFRWETLDYFVDKCREAGLEPAVCFYGTPRWASAKPDDARFFVHVWAYNAHPPRELADWTDFIGAMVDRYRGDVRIWGVWNEPNLPGGSCYWHGTPEDFAAMLKAAHATIRARQPEAEIWLDGTGSRYSEFYRRIVQLGAGGTFDKFGLHGHGANPAPLDRIDREHGVAPHGWVNSEWHAALQRYNSPAYAMSEPARALRMTLDFLRMLDLGASRAAYFEPFNLVEKETLRFHAEGGMPLNHSSGIFRQRPYLQPQYNAVVMANLGRWLSGDVAVDATYAFGNQRAAHLAGTRPLLVFWTTAEQPEPLDPRLLEALAGKIIEDWEGHQAAAAEGFVLKSQVLHSADLAEVPADWPRASGVFSPRADARPIQHTVEGVFGTRPILSGSGTIAANATWNDAGIRLHRLDGGAGDPAMRVRFAVAVLTNAVQLLVETTDARHHQPAVGAAMWQGDSIEFAFDFEGRGATQNRLEFIAGLTAFGPELFKTANADVSGDLPTAWTMPGRAVRGARVVVDLDAKAGVTRYAVEIPAGECYPYAPSPERPLRFALVVNENDGETRAAVATWGGGIFPVKDAAHYGDLKPAAPQDRGERGGGE